MATNEKKCDACGRLLTVQSTGTSLIGMQIEIRSMVSSVGTELKKLVAPYEINRQYNVCFPCLLKSLGIKPKGTSEIHGSEKTQMQTTWT